MNGICRGCNEFKQLVEHNRRDRGNKPYAHNFCSECAPDIWRNYKYKQKYGVTLEQYNHILEKQNSKCAICGTTKSNRVNNAYLAVDHDHENMQVRGLLCFDCNSGLGKFGDSIENLERAVAYLKFYRKMLD